MLKIIRSSDKLVFSKNNSNSIASGKNDDSKSVFERNNDNGEVRFGGDSVEYTKKSEKLKNQELFKLKKSKSRKIPQFWNLAKLKKKLSKSRNLSNFGTTKVKPKFLIPNIKIAFNCL